MPGIMLSWTPKSPYSHCLAAIIFVVDVEFPLPSPSSTNDVVSDVEYPLLAPAIIFIVDMSPPSSPDGDNVVVDVEFPL